MKPLLFYFFRVNCIIKVNKTNRILFVMDMQAIQAHLACFSKKSGYQQNNTF